MTSSVHTTELRQDIPLWMAQVLHACAQAEGVTRSRLVSDVLGEYCKRQYLRASLIQRTTRGNPDVPEVIPGAAE